MVKELGETSLPDRHLISWSKLEGNHLKSLEVHKELTRNGEAFTVFKFYRNSKKSRKLRHSN